MKNKEQAILNDMKIMEMALYYETKGNTSPVLNQEIISKRFVEFKRYITRGSFTIEQLEDRVYKEFGIMTNSNYEAELDFLDSIKELSMLYKERHEKDKK